MLYRKEANSRDRKSNIEVGGGGNIIEMRKEIRLKYSNMTKCLNTFVAHCGYLPVSSELLRQRMICMLHAEAFGETAYKAVS